jgi:hypothetical protein
LLGFVSGTNSTNFPIWQYRTFVPSLFPEYSADDSDDGERAAPLAIELGAAKGEETPCQHIFPSAIN